MAGGIFVQIATKLGQYQNAMETATAKATANGALEMQEVKRADGLLQQLKAGSVFEGTILKLENGQVKLGLSNGQILLARLQADMELLEGQSLFFQVKNNDGTKIQITPYMQGSQMANPALLQALQAAGLPKTQENLTMVDAMMQQQMRIDKQSLGQMARLVRQNPQIDVRTLVQLQKMQLPLTEEMATQLAAYRSGNYALTEQMHTLLQELPTLLSGAQSSQMECVQVNQQILQLLTTPQISPEGQESVQMAKMQKPALQPQVAGGAAVLAGAANSKTPISETGADQNLSHAEHSAQTEPSWKEEQKMVASLQDRSEKILHEASTTNTVHKTDQTQMDTPGFRPLQQIAPQQKTGEMSQKILGAIRSEQEGEPAKGVEKNSSQTKTTETTETDLTKPELGLKTESASSGLQKTEERLPENKKSLEPVLTEKELQQLNQKLQKIVLEVSPERMTEDIGFKSVTMAKSEAEFLQNLTKLLQNPQIAQSKALKELFGTTSYQKLIRQSFLQQWTMTPQETADKENVSQLYERLQQQVQKMEEIFQFASKHAEPLRQTAVHIEQNLDFMNQINQIYQYVQLPLKLSGQTMHSDLYVYTNRREQSKNSDELSAFLHLDLDALGTTDIAVQMKGRHVETQFYLADDSSWQLLRSHADTLRRMLEKKGYTCTVQVENKEKQTRPLEHFLQQTGNALQSGNLHRYSFDVKA
ncbi:MAG: flagellar hook-length control protein FliK [Lachnospiraceae bacterium]